MRLRILIEKMLAAAAASAALAASASWAIDVPAEAQVDCQRQDMLSLF